MHKTFDDARKAALEVINRIYGGEKLGCCVSESKISKDSSKTFFNFVFHTDDSNGKFVALKDGSFARYTRI